MFGLFKKFKEGFAKTFASIGEKTRGLFGGRRIDAASLGELEEAVPEDRVEGEVELPRRPPAGTG